MADYRSGLSKAQMAGWGLADLGVNIFVIVKQLILLAFMTQFLGVPVAIAGLITFGVLAFDIITDPLIGWLSDRTTTRWGRRLPFVFTGAVLMAVFTVMIFAVPASLTGVPAALWVAGFFVLGTIAFTLVVIPYGAMTAEMTQDPKERSTLTAFRMASASFGILLAGGLFPILHAGTREGHFFAALCFAPLMVLSIWLSVYASRKAPRVYQASTDGLGTQLSAAFSNRPFVLLVFIYGIQTVGIAVITAGIPFAAIYLITDNGGSPLSGLVSGLGVQSIVFAFFVLGSMISQPVWAGLSHRLGKPRAFITGSLVYALVLLAFFSLLPSSDMTLVAVFILAIGFCNGCYQQLPWAMLPDMIDLTTRQQGKAYEGSFNALWLFGQKVANAVGPLTLALILAAFGWISSTTGGASQSQEAVAALRWAMTLLPAFFLAASVPLYLVLSRRTL